MYKDTGFVLTELETEAGLGAILSGYAGNEELEEAEIEYEEDSKDPVLSLISAIEDEWDSSENRYNRDAVIFEYVKRNVQSFIDEYSRIEKLDFGLQKLAKKDDCIQILVRNSLVQLTGSRIYDGLNYEIISLERMIHENRRGFLVYDQVNRVQRIIHENSNNPMGLDKSVMKSILSCARLHINLWQLKTLSLEQYLEVQIENHVAMKREKKKPSKKYVLDRSNFYKSQRYPNMRPLQSFIDKKVDNVFQSIYEVSLRLSKDDYLSNIRSIANLD